MTLALSHTGKVQAKDQYQVFKLAFPNDEGQRETYVVVLRLDHALKAFNDFADGKRADLSQGQILWHGVGEPPLELIMAFEDAGYPFLTGQALQDSYRPYVAA